MDVPLFWVFILQNILILLLNRHFVTAVDAANVLENILFEYKNEFITNLLSKCGKQ